jgi:lipoyl(octanoyl) transferase
MFPVITRPLQTREYESSLAAMRDFTAHRTDDTNDEIWLVEHPRVFTLGLAGKPEHLLSTGDIAVIKTERGGQVTYHGPGQLVAYTLLDLRRRHLTVRSLVTLLERSAIQYFSDLGIATQSKANAPGVYLASGAKIAALGLKVSQGCCYHGIALNIDMDLEPFTRINPCGFPGLIVTDVRSCIGSQTPHLLQASADFAHCLTSELERLV